MTNQVAAISEIFSSLQGEGTHLGERHLFLRFESCNIHCEYCDELGKPGYDFDLDSVVESLIKLDQELGSHPYVSLTGGEPLVYVSFLKPLLPRLKEIGFKIYLETNGILWKALEQVISLTDVVAMDVKPASVTQERSFLKQHEAFLKIALQKETFIKMICSKEIDLDEFRELCCMIREVTTRHCERSEAIPSTEIASASIGTLPRNDGSGVPLILQPISGEIEGHEDSELMRLLGELQVIGLGILKDVRIVPRLHKILKIR